jgi:aerobic-type carbon monoxide dehydrogenase small subunit (CoxS/CutS family)
MMMDLRVNGETRRIDVDPATPLLYVLQNDLGLKGPRFGCGLAQCGACSVLADDVEIRSCVTPVSAVADKTLTTLEGVPAWYARRANLAHAPALHPLQEAMVAEQAPQCGYCTNGMVIKGVELLATNANPTRAEIVRHMDGHLCRCGTYARVVKAVERAATTMKGSR